MRVKTGLGPGRWPADYEKRSVQLTLKFRPSELERLRERYDHYRETGGAETFTRFLQDTLIGETK